MIRRPHIIAFSVVLVVVLILFSLPDSATARLKLALGSLFLPLFGLAGATHTVADKSGDALAPKTALIAQLHRLERENQELRTRLMQSEETVRENERLRHQLDWQKSSRLQLKAAQVVGRDPSNWWRTIQISLGRRDGVRPDQAVLTPAGLVGRVLNVAEFRSQVVLVGDPNCRVAALVQETRDNGVIAPGSAAPLDPSMVDLTYLSRTSQLSPGQTIVTSGLGGVFPKGIPIGKVVDLRSVGYGLYIEARVKLAVDLSKLEEVWVLFP